MADDVWHYDGFAIRLHDNNDGTFSLAGWDSAGAAGPADAVIHFGGHNIKLHDNGDGTYSLVTYSVG